MIASVQHILLIHNSISSYDKFNQCNMPLLEGFSAEATALAMRTKEI